MAARAQNKFMQTQTDTYEVIIIGAGASGLVCALELARGGKKVLVLEKEITCARKILVSGNGECNFTNRQVSPEKYYGDKAFVKAALEKVPGVTSVEVSLEKNTAVVQGNAKNDELIKAVVDAGYQASI